MNTPTNYLDHHRALLNELAENASKLRDQEAFTEEQHSAIYLALVELRDTATDQRYYELGQDTLCKIVAAWPQLTPVIARDLFWYFGGDCLQFMPDHEIAKYQLLDEARFEAESQGIPFDFNAVKVQIFGLH